MTKFELYKDSNGFYRFKLIAGNGKTILTSGANETKCNCKIDIQAVINSCQNKANYEIFESKNSNSFFNLRALNKKIVGRSRLYSSKRGLEYGISYIKKNALRAEVIE